MRHYHYYSNPSINDLGDIVASKESSYPGKSSIYMFGKTTEINFWGKDINNKGEVVGGKWLYSRGQTIELPIIKGQHTEYNAINDNTQIVGVVIWQYNGLFPLLLENGVITKLTPIGGEALDINNNEQIVGYYWGAPGIFSCLWERGATKWIMTRLDTVHSRANAINDKGQIVGSGISLAILYEIRNGELIKTNLNDFLSENSEFERLVSALGINNNGQIVGYGETRNEPGSQYAFLMTTISQPSADLTDDGIVNLYDLAEFASRWLMTEP